MEFDYSSGYSPRACSRCKRLKRKCDKSIPKCAPCDRSHFKCVYTYATTAFSEASPSIAKKTNAGARLVVPQHPPVQPQTSIRFLDHELYQRTVTDAPGPTIGISPELQTFIIDIRDHATDYFCAIHPWFPFISKKTFNERLLSPLTTRTSDAVLLFACIKLVCGSNEGTDMRTSAYLVVKDALFTAEMTGLLSIRILQAWILLCVYEFGHAIYPSAYLSIGACSRYAAALGLCLNCSNTRQISSWIEAEEGTRALWAILILDRLLNLGGPIRSLSVEDPKSDTQLPIDDSSWDEGKLKNDHISTLSTPPTPLMGRFGLMAMAASLLGKVIHHLNDPANIALPITEDLTILDRALAALTVVAREEGMNRGIGVCTPLILCHTARILLSQHKQRCEDAHGIVSDSRDNTIIRCGIASDMVQFGQWKITGSEQIYDEGLCPFSLHVAYQSAVTFLEANNQQRNDEYTREFESIRELFAWSCQRWKLAETYTQLLEAREALYRGIMPI